MTQLSAVSPCGGQQGTTVDLTISSGANLEGVKALSFSHPGITAAQKMAAPPLPELPATPIANQFMVTIAADVPAGVYDVRAVGTFGISNPRSFMVGNQPEIKEQSGNNNREKAQAIELNTVVNGISEANNSDWYKFAAKAGQRLVIDCWAQRIDSRMDATLALYNAAGKQLARSRDSNRHDPLIDFSVPADGEYFLQVYDFVYAGNSEYFYRFAVSTAPYIDYIFPPAGTSGAKGSFTLYGRNLPGGVPADGQTIEGRPLEKLAIEIDVPADQPGKQPPPGALAEPEEAELDGFPYRLTTPQGVSNVRRIGYATVPVVIEQEPNDEPAKANVVTLPCEYVGRFGPHGDQDWLQFEAKAGEVYWIEVFSQRLGLPTDPAVLLQRITKNDKGEEQAADITDLDDRQAVGGGLAFDTRTDDGAYRFAVPADGVYRAMVRDLNYGVRPDPRHVYRLSIHREQPDFRMAAVPVFPANNKQIAQPWNPLLRRGGTERFDVVAFRRDGFAGEITVTAEGLPAGVSCPPAVIAAGQNGATLVLTASDQVADWVGNIEIVGRAKIGETEVARNARAGTVLYAAQQNRPADARLARGLALAVTAADTAPFTVDLGEGKLWEMSRAGKLEIPVKLTRRGEIKGNLTLTAQGLPPNVQPQNLTFDGNTNEGKFTLQINANAPLGSFAFYLQTQGNVGYRRDPASAEAATKAKAEIEKLAADLATAAQAAETAKQAALKAATDADAALKAAQAAKQTADATAKQAADEAKVAADKATAAAAAAQADANNQDLAAAKAAAEKASAEAAAKAKTAAEAQAAAAKAATEAEAKLKAANEAKAAAEKAAADAAAKAKTAADLKTAAEKRATDATNAAASKDVQLFWPSTLTTIKITPAPITMTATSPSAALKQGAQAEVAVKITRLYGYADAVQLQAAVPNGVQGLTIAAATIAAGQNEAKLVIQAAATATPGNHTLTVKATAPFNGQQLTVDQPVNVVIEK
ncbi:MAG TPA: PPC domain-containing protein [Pirellulales bacterium]|nr:PPC domain-containing protein [Pirellulales bacterium]